MRRLGGSRAPPKKRRLPPPQDDKQPAPLLADAVDALFARPFKPVRPSPSASAPAAAVELAVFDGRRVERYAAGTTPPPPLPPRAVAAAAQPRAEDAVLAAAFQAMQKEVEAFGAPTTACRLPVPLTVPARRRGAGRPPAQGVGDEAPGGAGHVRAQAAAHPSLHWLWHGGQAGPAGGDGPAGGGCAGRPAGQES